MGAIESDLMEVQTLRASPDAPMMARLLGQARPEGIRRVFLTGANPFALPAGNRVRRLLSELGDILQRCDENDLRRYRENLPSL